MSTPAWRVLPDEWKGLLAERGLRPFRADQILQCLYRDYIQDWDLATTLPKDFRETLKMEFPLVPPTVLDRTDAADGTAKLLLGLTDGESVETVVIPAKGRLTQCVSSQVGCAMGCVFCCSGMGGFVRNLTRSEILEELLRLNALLPQDERLTHIVVMGTGEPTLNLDALLPALAEATSGDGLDIGNRRVTISTVGIPAGIRKLAEANVPYKLAVSLHAPNDRIRDAIMPQNRIHPIAEVLRAADVFFHTTGRRVTFEYVLLDGINSSVDDALELARLLRNKTAIVNCIPYNPAPELPYKTPSNATVRRFVDALEGEGIQVKVRFRKGDKINAACGQLRWSLREKE